MRSLNPPFRADHVGSLLRPRRLLDARARFHRSEMTKEPLRAVEDESIREVVRKGESIGLGSVTDGEFRRTFFHTDFLQRLQGVAIAGVIATKFHTRTGEIDAAQGNEVTEADQWATLELVVNTARDVWGGVV